MMLMSTKTRRRTVTITSILVLLGLVGSVVAGSVTGL